MAAASANINWSRSLETFVGQCAKKSANWEDEKALKSPALETYLLNATALPVSGLTVYFDNAPSKGYTVTRAAAQALLLATLDLGGAPPC